MFLLRQWEDIYELILPLPFALKNINAFLIAGKDSYTILDTGLNTEQSRAAWCQAQDELDWVWSDVGRIVITHYHPDHYGCAGWIQQQSNADVFISRKDYEQANLFFGRESEMPYYMAQFFARHGLDLDLVDQIPSHLQSYIKWVEPHPRVSFIVPGETILLGSTRYEALSTPGHADGHLSFWDPDRRWLLGGDFLLPKITPNISLWPCCSSNPLADYLETLSCMYQLPVELVLPSHGRAFTRYHARIRELQKHHAERLRDIQSILTWSGLTAYEVCVHYFGSNLNMHNLRFALSESIAHLEYLFLSNRIGKRELDDKIKYTK